MKKLNLGCGKDIKSGYINIDFRKGDGVDLVHDLMKPLPFDDESCTDIMAHDILEHFGFRETEIILADWIRALGTGGCLDLVVPNFEAHLQYYKADKQDPRYVNGYDDSFEFFRANVFGGQDYEGNFHKTFFTPRTVERLLEKAGLKLLKMGTPRREINVLAVKE